MTMVQVGARPWRRALSLPARPDPEQVVRDLLAAPKTVPGKLHFDEKGARLFQRICRLPDYYLARAELEILRERSSEIRSLAGGDGAVIELGSGSGATARVVLDAVEPSFYLPIDLVAAPLARLANELADEYPAVWVRPLCADYGTRFRAPPLPEGLRRLACLFGSQLGAFPLDQATDLLRRIRGAVGDDGAVLLGLDRAKSRSELEAAYCDPDGAWAAFSLNLLVRLNRELGADFDPTRFRHLAFYNRRAGRVETHLLSVDEQVVYVAGVPIPFQRGETIWTGSAYQYDLEMLERVAGLAGFGVARLWTDDAEKYWVAYLE